MRCIPYLRGSIQGFLEARCQYPNGAGLTKVVHARTHRDAQPIPLTSAEIDCLCIGQMVCIPFLKGQALAPRMKVLECRAVDVLSDGGRQLLLRWADGSWTEWKGRV